jgi:hypothetical protein
MVAKLFNFLYLNKLENLEEMDKFLDKYYHPKLNHEDINHPNRFILFLLSHGPSL